jgi:hypothetical protein
MGMAAFTMVSELADARLAEVAGASGPRSKMAGPMTYPRFDNYLGL